MGTYHITLSDDTEYLSLIYALGVGYGCIASSVPEASRPRRMKHHDAVSRRVLEAEAGVDLDTAKEKLIRLRNAPPTHTWTAEECDLLVDAIEALFDSNAAAGAFEERLCNRDREVTS